MIAPFKKILFTGDVFRPDIYGQPHQSCNIDWLYHYFKPYLNILLPEINLTRLIWGTTGDFDPSFFYNELGLCVDCNSWAKIFNCDHKSKELEKLIDQYFLDSFIIAFELPQFLVKSLTDAGIPYLNFEIAPYRFLDDLCLEATTNNQKLGAYLSSISLSNDYVRCSAGRIIANVSRSNQLFDKSSILIVGQTVGDRSLIHNGAFLTLNDFVEELRGVVGPCNNVFYKPHPDDANELFFDKEILSKLGVKLIKGNIYRFFSQEKLLKVVGVNSSCLYESPFFETDSYFLGNQRKLGSVIYGNFNSFSFWADVLSSLDVQFQGRCLPEIICGPNTLRKSIDAWWGQGGVDSILPGINNNYSDELSQLRNTISWKITAPIRIVGRLMNDFKR